VVALDDGHQPSRNANIYKLISEYFYDISICLNNKIAENMDNDYLSYFLLALPVDDILSRNLREKDDYLYLKDNILITFCGHYGDDANNIT
jgi:hypothetical protein